MQQLDPDIDVAILFPPYNVIAVQGMAPVVRRIKVRPWAGPDAARSSFFHGAGNTFLILRVFDVWFISIVSSFLPLDRGCRRSSRKNSFELRINAYVRFMFNCL